MKKITFLLSITILFACNDTNHRKENKTYHLNDEDKKINFIKEKEKTAKFLELSLKYLGFKPEKFEQEYLNPDDIKKITGENRTQADLKKDIYFESLTKRREFISRIKEFILPLKYLNVKSDPAFEFFNKYICTVLFKIVNIYSTNNSTFNYNAGVYDLIRPNPLTANKLKTLKKAIKEFINVGIAAKNYLVGQFDYYETLNISKENADKLINSVPNNSSIISKADYIYKDIPLLIDYAFEATKRAKEIGIPKEKISRFMEKHIELYNDLFEKAIEFLEILAKGLDKAQKIAKKEEQDNSQLSSAIESLKNLIKELSDYSTENDFTFSNWSRLREMKKLQIRNLADKL